MARRQGKSLRKAKAKGVRRRRRVRKQKRRQTRRPMRVLLYQMTISSAWYDSRERKAKEFELHYKVARHGRITTVRRHLADRGVPHFQRTVYRLSGRWIPKRKVRVRFEREQPALRSQATITVEARRMEYRGKQWKAYVLPTRTLSYARKRRRRK